MNEWIDLELINGYTSECGQVVQYKRLESGEIIFRGCLGPGEEDQPFGKLPFEMEPRKYHELDWDDTVSCYEVDEHGYLYWRKNARQTVLDVV
jgi:hypothetical protein